MGHPRESGTGDDIGRQERDEAELIEAAPDAMFSLSAGKGLTGVVNRTDSYGFVLLLLSLLIWVFTPFASSERWAVIPTVIAYGTSIVIALHTSFVPRPRVRLALVIVVALMITATVGLVIDNVTLRVVANIGFSLLLVLTASVVVVRVMRHTSVTTRTISGAVAVYLLLALAFSDAFSAVESWHPGSFTNLSGQANYGPLQYFSLVTLATLGYGDITPVSSVARSLATLEAIGGQIFLVTIVARLVSLFGASARRSSAGGSELGDGNPKRR